MYVKNIKLWQNGHSNIAKTDLWLQKYCCWIVQNWLPYRHSYNEQAHVFGNKVQTASGYLKPAHTFGNNKSSENEEGLTKM